ncbi:MAG: Eco57I restriction-modification methylase domain-containing protein [Actinomycetota bacterium]
MKVRSEVTSDKLRGGFYTPDALVDQTVHRLVGYVNGSSRLSVLEPSAGDGAFIRGLARSRIAERIEHVYAVEILRKEADRCRAVAAGSGLRTTVSNADFLEWREANPSQVDVVVGNPPFVRFQFVDDESKILTAKLADEIGRQLGGVSNLWIPVLLGALSNLRPGGAFSLVVPAECFTGISAGVVRTWLVASCSKVMFDLFPPGSFPGVLQEIVILSGKRNGGDHESVDVTVVEHELGRRRPRSWTYHVKANGQTWTRYLLEPSQLDALDAASSLACVSMLKDVAKFEVAAVTGANDFFSIDSATIDGFDLAPWVDPLLPRVRHARGLVYTPQDHTALVSDGLCAGLLNFSADRPDPMRRAGPRRYLESGEKAKLHLRYKTRIREPWFRVPHVRSEPLMLSKRCHWYPRVISNRANVVTTDTIYRGQPKTDSISCDDFVAAFHNSLTLLTAEIEGRSFGGGVLELVPSEIARLAVPVLQGFGSHLARLDAVMRDIAEPNLSDALIAETNRLVATAGAGLTVELLSTLDTARQRLAQRRLDRTSMG